MADQRALDLPLADRPGCDWWAGPGGDGVWPGLLDALTAKGRRYLAVALREALAAGDDPERALQVVEAFMRTMRLRRGPGYEGRMEAAWSRQGGERG